MAYVAAAPYLLDFGSKPAAAAAEAPWDKPSEFTDLVRSFPTPELLFDTIPKIQLVSWVVMAVFLPSRNGGSQPRCVLIASSMKH